jgi:hypothetical protein
MMARTGHSPAPPSRHGWCCNVIDTREVTACFVTRGDQPEAMQRIRDSLIFENVIVWDNSAEEHDYKVAGRYAATLLSETKAVYYQDDDCIIPEGHTASAPRRIRTRCDGRELGPRRKPGRLRGRASRPRRSHRRYRASRGVRSAVPRAITRWTKLFCTRPTSSLASCTKSSGTCGCKFDIDMAIAQHPSRLCNQEWQRDLKFDVTQRARAIRDRGEGGQCEAAPAVPAGRPGRPRCAPRSRARCRPDARDRRRTPERRRYRHASRCRQHDQRSRRVRPMGSRTRLPRHLLHPPHRARTG